jgi:hypothetical protein
MNDAGHAPPRPTGVREALEFGTGGWDVNLTRDDAPESPHDNTGGGAVRPLTPSPICL